MYLIILVVLLVLMYAYQYEPYSYYEYKYQPFSNVTGKPIAKKYGHTCLRTYPFSGGYH